MKKTLSINIGGRVFHIEEDAYDKLNHYLDAIIKHFSQEEGKDEILLDIESRVAEMLQEKMEKSKQEAVTIGDVTEVIDIMGKPEDFGDVDEEEYEAPPRNGTAKQFFRNPDNKIMGGVCSGISSYFGIDPLWLRLAFVLSWFMWGVGILIYIILWIVIPEAKSAADKLKMKGERVNLSNIEKKVKEEMETLKDRIDDLSSKKNTNKAKGFIESAVTFVISVIKTLFELFIKVVGVFMLAIGLFVLLALVLAFVSSFGVVNIFYPFLLPAFFPSVLFQILGIVGILLLIGIPVIAVIIKGLQILFDLKLKFKGVGIGFVALWIIGVILCGVVSIQTLSDFSKKGKQKETIAITQPSSGTLYLQVAEDPETVKYGDHNSWSLAHEMDIVDINEKLIISKVNLNIARTNSPDFELIQIRSALGNSTNSGRELAKEIHYKVIQKDSILIFDPYLFIEGNSKWRNQKVELILKVPIGKSVHFSYNMGEIIYDIDNITNTYDKDMVDHQWVMLDMGLDCVDCDEEQNNKEYHRNYKSEKISKLSGFNKVAIDGRFNVSIRPGEKYMVVQRGSSKSFGEVDLRVVSNTLKADMDRSFWDLFHLKKAKPISIEIIMPELEYVMLEGLCKARIKGFEEDEFSIDLAGVSEAKIDIIVETLDADIAGASKLTLNGNAEFLNIDISGACTLQAYGMEADEVDIDVSGACSAYVHAKESLIVDAHGASHVVYIGNPQVDSDATGASSVKRK